MPHKLIGKEQEIIRLYNSGVGTAELGREFGVSQSAMSQAVKRYLPRKRERAMQFQTRYQKES